MIYILVSKMSDGTFFELSFNKEQEAIAQYEKDKRWSFNGVPMYSSVQLFQFCLDPQEKGNYPIYKPIEKYINGKWIKTKFYKKFIYKGVLL